MGANARFIQAAGKAGRTVVARLKPKTDLVGGLIEICEANNIRCGAVLGGLGTLERAVFLSAAPAPGTKSGIGYSDTIRVEGPVEFICGQGLITEKEGEIFIHFHGMFMDMNMKVYGGHFNPGENPVLSTIDVVIFEAEGVRAPRLMDEELDLVLMFPEKT